MYFMRIGNSVLLFWAAFIISRPFGAVFGNLFDKPVERGGFGISRLLLTTILLVVMIVCLVVLPQRAKARSEGAAS
jgi:uncharacterized membrane-anchored protein